MTLASLLILAGIVCLVAGIALPILYTVRRRIVTGQSAHVRARLVGATSAFGPR